jgi:DNA-binding NarL/FixJ family response regulator
MTSGTAATRRPGATREGVAGTVIDMHGDARRPGESANVVIADGQAAFREGLRACLGAGFYVLGEAASVAELAHLVRTTAPADLLIVSQDLPGGGLPSALEVAPRSATIVVFADRPRDDLVIDALQLGVSGYLLKSTPASAISPTLRAALAGEPVIDRSLVKTLVDEIARQGPIRRLEVGGHRVPLTPRERQVADLLASGHSTRAIAAKLGVSPVTARRHISSVMRKLQVATREAAVELVAG